MTSEEIKNSPNQVNVLDQTQKLRNESSTSTPSALNKLSIPKEKMCGYSERICRRPCVSSSNYCEIHLSLAPKFHMSKDSSDNFIKCSFVATKTSRQCWNPAVTQGSDASQSKHFCRQHKIKYLMAQKKKRVQHLSSKAIVDKYTRNLKILQKRNQHQHTMLIDSPDAEHSSTNHKDKLPTPFEDFSPDDSLVDMNDSDEELIDTLPISKFQPDFMENDIETDSRDLTSNEPLRHACIYTSEEIGRILCLKMKRLQQLYKQQFKFLEYEMKLANVEYFKQISQLSASSKSQLNNNKEAGNENLPSSEARQSVLFLRNMRRHKGQEALLKMKLDEKRRIFSTTDDSNSINVSAFQFQAKCAFIAASKGNLKCGKRTVPKSRYCLQHIMSDKNQILFTQCQTMGDDSKRCPIVLKPYLCESFCDFHRKLQPVASAVLFEQT